MTTCCWTSVSASLQVACCYVLGISTKITRDLKIPLFGENTAALSARWCMGIYIYTDVKTIKGLVWKKSMFCMQLVLSSRRNFLYAQKICLTKAASIGELHNSALSEMRSSCDRQVSVENQLFVANFENTSQRMSLHAWNRRKRGKLSVALWQHVNLQKIMCWQADDAMFKLKLKKMPFRWFISIQTFFSTDQRPNTVATQNLDHAAKTCVVKVKEWTTQFQNKNWKF